MDFTYEGYHNLLLLLRTHGYEIADYYNWNHEKRCVILRHDVDSDIGKALEMARMEYEWEIKSNYFVLLTSDFYNVFSRSNCDKLHEILRCGHTIGLHFDEMNYPELNGDTEAICEKIQEEAELLGKVVGKPITTVSMHRPSRQILETDLGIPGIVNSYGQIFFHEFKYLSDSRCHWREPIEEIIKSGQYERLHILTHAFWYYKEERNFHDTVKEFVNRGNKDRYYTLSHNMTDLESVMKPEEVR